MNPQSTNPGWTPARRARLDWLRTNLADQCAAGSALDPADLAALPGAFKAKAQKIAAHASELHDAGEQGNAVSYARESFTQLEQMIGPKWSPPRERPDQAVIDAIPRSL